MPGGFTRYHDLGLNRCRELGSKAEQARRKSSKNPQLPGGKKTIIPHLTVRVAPVHGTRGPRGIRCV